MFSIISTAFGYLLLLIIVVTPVGQWLLLSSAFWTMGMEIIFYFVDNNYPDKVVAVVSAVVAILFVCIVRVIWNVLPPLVDLPSDDKAVCAARPVASAAAGKYGMSHRDLLVESASSFSSSVSGSRPNHTLHEYRDPVGGSTLVVARPSWIMPEIDAVFASLSSDRLRMPEVEKKAYSEHAKNVVNASHCVSRFLPIDKQLVAVPSPAAVADGSADASWRSDLAESNNVSLSSVSRSTGVSDSGFVASASNAAGMTKAVNADVSCGRVAGSEPLGDDAGTASATACFGADDGVAAASGGDDTQVGAAFGDAMLDASASVLGAVPSGVPVSGASSAALVCPIVSVSACATRGSHVGIKRSCDWEFSLFAHQDHAKKYKVAPLAIDDGFLLPVKFEGSVGVSVSGPAVAVAAMEICPPSPVPMDLDCPSFMEPMEICPPSPAPVPLASPAVKPMDLDSHDMDHSDDQFASFVAEASPMDIVADGFLFFGLPVASPFAGASCTAFLTTPATTAAATSKAMTTTTAAAASTSAFTTATTRCIAVSRARRFAAGVNVAPHSSTTSTSTSTGTTLCGATADIVTAAAILANTAATTATVAAATTINASIAATNISSSSAVKTTTQLVNQKSDTTTIKSNNGNDEKQVEKTSNSTKEELEECILDPREILDPSEYPEENDQYDEFEGFDFTEGLDLIDRLL